MAVVCIERNQVTLSIYSYTLHVNVYNLTERKQLFLFVMKSFECSLLLGPTKHSVTEKLTNKSESCPRQWEMSAELSSSEHCPRPLVKKFKLNELGPPGGF